MREKNIFLMGLGTGLVIVSIISLFLYNLLKPYDSHMENNITSTTTEIITEATTQDVSSTEISSIEMSTKEMKIDTTIQTTTKNLELSSKPNLEITTSKPLKIEN
ncbi:hypothetical protein [uncultured Tyzzerella sp.]|uniref:hypothetical protein n=1 Tax=uncultured Tyzzerella sp. TaxID=2321398 RepID=UPI00294299A3|nr:hypothetical protein [uncultured Tyzzerella sp.]